MAYEQRLIVRFDEVDFAQLVYFPRLFGYCHQVFEDFFRNEVHVPYAQMLQERRVGYPTVHAEADFHAPLRFGDEVTVVMDTLKVGARSITSRYRLYRDPARTLCVTARIVTVAMSMDAYQSVDVPEDVRAAFVRHAAADMPA